MEATAVSQRSGARVLFVDDDPILRRSWSRFFRGTPMAMEAVADGAEAIDRLREDVFDVVVSDVAMPEMDGVELLRFVRAHHPGTPVILVTGTPTLGSAADAVEYGAVRYLLKPVAPNALLAAITEAMERRTLSDGRSLDELARDGERCAMEERLDRALEGLWMAYQPIVFAKKREVFGYEALVRTVEPSVPHPGALFELAERLGAVHRVGRAIREQVAAHASQAAAAATTLFVNLHPLDLLDDDLYAARAPLSTVAERIILEITERETLDHVADLGARLAELRRLGFRVALDDLGAGYAGLSSFAAMAPEIVKLDMSLTNAIDASPVKRKLIYSLVSLCKNLGALVVAEGVERPEEREALVELGCDLLQGYLLARPGRGFPTVNW